MGDVAMNTMLDRAPLWRSRIGFDHLFDVLGQAMNTDNSAKYPPYDTERTGEDAYRLPVGPGGLDGESSYGDRRAEPAGHLGREGWVGRHAIPLSGYPFGRVRAAVQSCGLRAGSRCADGGWPVGHRPRARIARGSEAASYRNREQQRAAGVGAGAGCVSLQAP